MTVQELDAFLKNITKEEALYLKGWVNPIVEADLMNVTINGEQYRVVKNNKRMRVLDGSKHERFNQYPAHIHRWVELCYMYSGSCMQTINHQSVLLQTGQAILLDQNTLHEVPVLGENDILLNIYIQKEFLDARFFSRISQRSVVAQFLANVLSKDLTHSGYIVFQSEKQSRLPSCVQEFFCEIYDPHEYEQEVLESYFLLILTELSQSVSFGTEEKQGRRTMLVHSILRYIEAHYPDISLAETATQFSVNPHYLSCILKEETGSSFQGLVNQQRISAAKSLLLHPSLSIVEIANRVGYENTTFFYRKFKDSVGCTPNEYRNKAHNSSH